MGSGHRKTVVAAIATVILLLGAAALWLAGRPSDDGAAQQRPVRLGLALQPPSALMILAHGEGFFAAEGLDVRVTEYVSGKRALAGLLSAEVDVATTAAVPIVFAAFERKDLKILATIASVGNEQRIVARKSRGIQSPKDLRGKRVATQRGSAVHFFLHLFLTKHGLSGNDVRLSFMKAEQLPQSLAQGEIDAFSMREPFVSRARGLLAGDAVVFAEPGLYFRTEHLITTDRFIQGKSGTIRKLLRALLRAEQLARSDPERARRLVAARLDISQSALASSWPDFELEVSLDQALLTSMEDQARWAIESGLTERRAMPNYLEFIHTAGLDAEKPDAVTIIR